MARRRSDTQKERIRTSRKRGSESGVERTGMGVFLFTRGFGFAWGGRAPWSRRVDTMTDHETHPSTLGPNSTSTGSTVSRGSPSAVSAARKIEIFPARFFVVPLLFSRNGAREGVQVRGETRRGTRDAPSHAWGPPSSREAFLAQVRARTRDVRARFALRQVEIPATVARARRVICRVCASASSSPARCAGVREFGLAGPAGRGRGRNRTARGNASRGIPPSSASRTRAPRPPARARDPVVTLNSLTVGALPPLPQDRTFSRLSPRRPWSSAT